jgi:hypothetical protein
MPGAGILESADLPGAAAAWQLSCPVCGAAEVEQGPRSGPDHTAVTIQPDRDGYDSPVATRGGYVSMRWTARPVTLSSW